MFGIVIGTYGKSMPYIDLHLSIRNKYYPEVPLLISDDCSFYQKELIDMCKKHSNVYFRSNNTRFGHQSGDLTSFLYGLEWAKDNKIDYLIKFSRRFVPLIDWRNSLIEKINQYNHHTYSYKYDDDYSIRTDCIALKTTSWIEMKEYLKALIGKGDNVPNGVKFLYKDQDGQEKEYSPPFAEWKIGYLALILSRGDMKNYYCQWDALLNKSRKEKHANSMSPYSYSYDEYAKLANEFNLNYTSDDFSNIDKPKVKTLNFIRKNHNRA